MIIGLQILMIAILSLVFYEDMKERKVTTYALLLLLVLGGFLNSQHHFIELFLISTLMNIAIVSGVVLILFLYAKFKLKTSLFKVFGVGDLLFFAFMAVSFPTATFLVLFSSSLIFSLTMSIVFKAKLKKFVPLAGLQALYLAMIVGVNLLWNVVDLYAI